MASSETLPADLARYWDTLSTDDRVRILSLIKDNKHVGRDLEIALRLMQTERSSTRKRAATKPGSDSSSSSSSSESSSSDDDVEDAPRPASAAALGNLPVMAPSGGLISAIKKKIAKEKEKRKQKKAAKKAKKKAHKDDDDDEFKSAKSILGDSVEERVPPAMSVKEGEEGKEEEEKEEEEAEEAMPEVAPAEAKSHKRHAAPHDHVLYTKTYVNDATRTPPRIHTRNPLFEGSRPSANHLALGLPSYLAQHHGEEEGAILRQLFKWWHEYDDDPKLREQIILHKIKELTREKRYAHRDTPYATQSETSPLELLGQHPETEQEFGMQFDVRFGPREIHVNGGSIVVIAATPHKQQRHAQSPLSGIHLFHESIGIPIHARLPSPYTACPVAETELMFVDDGRSYVNRAITADVVTRCGGVRYIFFFNEHGHLALLLGIGLGSMGTEVSPQIVGARAAAAASSGSGNTNPPPPVRVATATIFAANVTNKYLDELRASNAAFVDVANHADATHSIQLTNDVDNHLAIVAAGDNWFKRLWKRGKQKVSNIAGKGIPVTILTSLDKFYAKAGAEDFRVAIDAVTKDAADVEGEEALIDKVTIAATNSLKEIGVDKSQCMFVALDSATEDSGNMGYIHIALRRDLAMANVFDAGFKPMEVRFQIYDNNLFREPLEAIAPGAIYCHISDTVVLGDSGTWVVNFFNYKHKGASKDDAKSHVVLLHLRKGNSQYAPPVLTRIAIIAKP